MEQPTFSAMKLRGDMHADRKWDGDTTFARSYQVSDVRLTADGQAQSIFRAENLLALAKFGVKP